MNKVIGIVCLLCGLGFGVLALKFGDLVPQSKIPFIGFAVVLVLGGLAILFWEKIAGKPAQLPEEKITVVEAKDSPTGKSTIRIPLDGIEVPIKG